MLWPSEVSCSAYHLLWEDSFVFIVRKVPGLAIYISKIMKLTILIYDRKKLLSDFEPICTLFCFEYFCSIKGYIHIDNIQNVVFKEEGNWVT